MAQSKNNIITHGLSGKVGNIVVFSQRGGKTIVSKIPKRKAPDSEKQKAHKRKFQKAIFYAKSAMADPLIKEQYQKTADRFKGITAYNVAIADLMNPPKIEEIDLSHYTGKSGDLIKIRAYDDFKVKAVTVKIETPDGVLIEEGNAGEEDSYWIYTARVNNTNVSGNKITIKATDIPDNTTEKVQIL